MAKMKTSANVLLVSTARKGEIDAIMIPFRQILEEQKHYVEAVKPPAYNIFNPDLKHYVARFRPTGYPDIVFLSTSNAMVPEVRKKIYDHLTEFEKIGSEYVYVLEHAVMEKDPLPVDPSHYFRYQDETKDRDGIVQFMLSSIQNALVKRYMEALKTP